MQARPRFWPNDSIGQEERQRIVEEVIDAEAQALSGFASAFDKLKTEGFRASIGSGDKIRAAATLFDAVTEL